MTHKYTWCFVIVRELVCAFIPFECVRHVGVINMTTKQKMKQK